MLTFEASGILGAPAIVEKLQVKRPSWLKVEHN